MYLNHIRPDISYAVQQLCQFLHDPRDAHLSVAMHVLRYLKGTLNMGLFYPTENSMILSGYTDADWGTCADTCRSLYGCTTLVSWKTK